MQKLTLETVLVSESLYKMTTSKASKELIKASVFYMQAFWKEISSCIWNSKRSLKGLSNIKKNPIKQRLLEDQTMVGLRLCTKLATKLLPEMYAKRLTLREGVKQILQSIPSASYAENSTAF